MPVMIRWNTAPACLRGTLAELDGCQDFVLKHILMPPHENLRVPMLTLAQGYSQTLYGRVLYLLALLEVPEAEINSLRNEAGSTWDGGNELRTPQIRIICGKIIEALGHVSAKFSSDPDYAMPVFVEHLEQEKKYSGDYNKPDLLPFERLGQELSSLRELPARSDDLIALLERILDCADRNVLQLEVIFESVRIPFLSELTDVLFGLMGAFQIFTHCQLLREQAWADFSANRIDKGRRDTIIILTVFAQCMGSMPSSRLFRSSLSCWKKLAAERSD